MAVTNTLQNSKNISSISPLEAALDTLEDGILLGSDLSAQAVATHIAEHLLEEGRISVGDYDRAWHDAMLLLDYLKGSLENI